MIVFRTKPLPVRENRGRIIIPESVALHSRIALMGFSGMDGKHEGILFWAGRKIDQDFIVSAILIPTCEHSPMRVMVDEKAVGKAMKKARSYGLGLVAPVHSHGGEDTRHSDGDDDLIVMPKEGMFSIVVGNYGAGGITQDTGVGLHQYQDGRWVKIDRRYSSAIKIVPTIIEVIW